MSEYYEPYRRGRGGRPRKRRSFGGWLLRALFRLIGLCLAVAVVAALALYALPPGFFQVEDASAQLALTDNLPAKCANILILGVDRENQGAQRSDAIMVASVGYGSLKLTSFQRDVVVQIPGHGSAKLNAAYAYGGAELTMRTLNENFALNIMKYAVVDFACVVKLVDALGGVTLDVTEAEMAQVNANIWLARGVFGPLGYAYTPLETFGDGTRLNGLQALGYARIRKIDSDFMRTSRQRRLIGAAIAQAKKNPIGAIRGAAEAIQAVKTNMSLAEMLSLGEKALLAGSIEQLRLPVDGSFSDNGSTLKLSNQTANIQALYEFIYQ